MGGRESKQLGCLSHVLSTQKVTGVQLLPCVSGIGAAVGKSTEPGGGRRGGRAQCYGMSSRGCLGRQPTAALIAVGLVFPWPEQLG